MTDLRFPRVDLPDVSVVVVTHNARDWTQRALRALIDNTEACYETIVVDNASSDGTRELLADVANASVILNDANHGFGAANNQGAAMAVGRHLLFLNSDALVQRGWLPPLLGVLEEERRVGAVGPRLLNPDGSLQLAGALVARTGSTMEYGFGDDPESAEYTFRREVDYLSGACLAVRRSAFDEVGGFDPVYGLGYFEDADLCLAFAARGHRVVYEPRSVVMHVRGASGGSEALAQLALRNRSIFHRRWEPVLASRPLSPLQSRPGRILAARDASASARILVVLGGSDPELVNALAPWALAARVTILALGHGETLSFDPEIESAWADGGIDAWLRERRFHYDVVIATSEDDRLEALLAETQPTAVRIPAAAVSAQALAAAGVAPPG